MYLLALADRSYTGACAGSGDGSDGSALAAASDSADDGSNGGSGSDLASGAFAATLRVTRPLAGAQVVGFTVEAQRGEFQGKRCGTRVAARALDVHDAALDVGILRDDDLVVNHYGSVQRCAERIAH